jgi:4-diphosphocytidyl-2-C-methyl-D-erythritol kinase
MVERTAEKVLSAANAGPRLQLRTPAKLNLFLHITGRRSDGYHLLQSVIRAVNLFDQIELSRSDDGLITRTHGLADVPPEQDLTVRAAQALQHYSRCRFGAQISVHKHIPTGAGMGGGSGNAAGVLRALNGLWQLGVSTQTLAEIGLKLGADVPFFLHGLDQWVSGVGEQISPIVLPAAHYVIVHPGVHCATAELFADADLQRTCTPISAAEYLAGAATCNVFEPVVFARYPQVRAAYDWLKQNAGNARLTGSGSALFASVPSHVQAMQIKALCPPCWRAWYGASMHA